LKYEKDIILILSPNLNLKAQDELSAHWSNVQIEGLNIRTRH
jgi:hypothetical protein